MKKNTLLKRFVHSSTSRLSTSLRYGLLVFGLVFSLPAIAGLLEHDERVMFFPDVAFTTEGGDVEMYVQAWVFEFEKREFIANLLANQAGLKIDKLSAAEKQRFNEVSRYFRTDSDGGAEVQVKVDGMVMSLPDTDRSGRATDIMFVSHPPTAQRGAVTYIPFKLLAPREHPTPDVESFAVLVPETGVSVISDIDDTIKASNVLNRVELLRNTFIRPFVAVPGMPEWYRQLEKQLDGVAFHYLSSSPMQLYPFLSAFLDENGFPLGSIHLRESTSITTVVPNSDSSPTHKRTQLKRLFTLFPKRQFILIGDSGEKDPELYAEILRLYPHQVQKIYIRDVTGEPRKALRYRELFYGLPEEILAIIK